MLFFYYTSRFFERLDSLFPQWNSVKYITFFSPGLISDIIVDWWNVEMEGTEIIYVYTGIYIYIYLCVIAINVRRIVVHNFDAGVQ